MKNWALVLASAAMLSNSPVMGSASSQRVAGLELTNPDDVLDIAGGRFDEADELLVLQWVEGSVALERAYGLPVREVPEPPGGRVLPPTVAPEGCPFELRAIVEGPEASDSFAIVASNSAAESEILYNGDRFRTGGARWKLVAVAADHITLRQGEATVRCVLAP